MWLLNQRIWCHQDWDVGITLKLPLTLKCLHDTRCSADGARTLRGWWGGFHDHVASACAGQQLHSHVASFRDMFFMCICPYYLGSVGIYDLRSCFIRGNTWKSEFSRKACQACLLKFSVCLPWSPCSLMHWSIFRKWFITCRETKAFCVPFDVESCRAPAGPQAWACASPGRFLAAGIPRYTPPAMF